MRTRCVLGLLALLGLAACGRGGNVSFPPGPDRVTLTQDMRQALDQAGLAGRVRVAGPLLLVLGISDGETVGYGLNRLHLD